jgi:hypothetical protein
MKIKYVFLTALVAFSFFINVYFFLEIIRLKADFREIPEVFPSVENAFKRGDHIRKVAEGDANAAFALGRYYGTEGITEAQLYWFTTAKNLGHKGVSEELLKANERSILDAHRMNGVSPE